MQPLVELMTKTEKVRITGPGTDLSFSIAGIPAVPCDGRCNIPDGEVYSAPLRDSVNGTLRYNVPSQEEGVTFHDVCLRFEQGRIVEATAGPNTERLNAILDTDAGARYIGEFALGVNPMVTTPINDILFDEKIAGSFHFTPGSCYEDANNGNQSAIHWDLVCMQDAAHGGGEIWFDDRLIRKDGRFVLPELQALDRLD
jgi:aminopeptidase